MKISVIISAYNCENFLPTTLAAIHNQDYPSENLEIIVVNDGSTDSTAEILKSPEWKDSIIVVNHSENRGRASTRNSGVKAATGELIVFLDCDVEVKPDFISKSVEYHKRDEIIAVVSHPCTRKTDLKDKFHRYIFFSKRGAPAVGENRPLPFQYYLGGCLSVKADALKKTGMFNEALPTYGIDLEYGYRLWKNYPDGLYYFKAINVYMNHEQILETTLSNFRDYGRRNVPIILEQFPELAPYVGADFIKSLNGGLSSKVIVGSLLINPVVFYSVKWLLPVIPYPVSNTFIRYLLVASIAMGYREALNMK